MIRRHRRRRDDHLGAERLEQAHFFLRHLVRHREDALVALERRGDRQSDAGVAARALDDRAARLEASLALRLLDDRHADAVLDRAAGIEDLRLRVHRRANAARHSVEADERRPPDRAEDVVVRFRVALRHRSHERIMMRRTRASDARAAPSRRAAAALRDGGSRRETESRSEWPRRAPSPARSEAPARPRAPPCRAPDSRWARRLVVESAATRPSRSMKMRSVTLPCTRRAYSAAGYRNGSSAFSSDGISSGRGPGSRGRGTRGEASPGRMRRPPPPSTPSEPARASCGGI